MVEGRRVPVALAAVFALTIACSSADLDVGSPADDVGTPVEGGGDDARPGDDVSTVDATDTTTTSPPDTLGFDTTPLTCDPSEKPEASAVYVSATSGNDGTGDGSAGAPLKTIGKSITVARAKGAGQIVLDEGSYPEAVRIPSADAELRIEGGWKQTGTVWARTCLSDMRARTVIASTDAIAIIAEQPKKRTGLRFLTVQSKPTGNHGESVFALIVRGDDSVFFLDDTAMIAGNGGPGLPAASTTPTAPPSCNRVLACSAAGTAGAAGKNGEPGLPGKFSKDGYSPLDGIPGLAGTSGGNGTPGGAASSMSNCNWGCSGSAGCDSTKLTTTVSKPGNCGCGGIGGAGGAPGHGGPATVAVLVVGKNATVSVRGSKLTSGTGGDGTAGAAGAAASAATSGAAGDPSYCHKGGCTGTTSACYYADGTVGTVVTGGTPGGAGLSGGKGGDGGGAAGGPSYAIVTVSGALVINDAASTLAPGKGGPGSGSAPAGDYADKHDQP